MNESALEKILTQNQAILDLLTRQDNLLRAEQVAERLAVSKNSVYQFARLGVLPSVRLGETVRFRSSDIDRIVAEGSDARVG